MDKNNIRIAILLVIRIVLMILLQVITYWMVIDKESPFQYSGYFWATHLSIVNALLLVMMIILLRKKGIGYFGFFKQANKSNSLYFLKIFFPLFICAMLPNILLSILLYQDPQIGSTFLIGDIPFFFVLINITIFPILQGLVELPFYFSFIMPKIQNLTHNKWVYIGLPVLFLSIQHMVMPLRFELTYIIYRSLMFFPFAVFIGFLMHKKPSMMPYLVIMHILMNASLSMMYFM